MKYKVELEDNGQDFLEFITDKNGVILEAKPFLTEIWAGGYIPLKIQKIGDFCMMHKPPHIITGYLKHRVTNIEEIKENDDVACMQCESCSKEFDMDTMTTDADDNYFCKECWEELAPLMQQEYEELKAKGEID